MPADELKGVEETKRRIELKGQSRDFVFGIQDGLISILGLITGVFGAYGDQPTIVVVTGITGAIAAAISMAAGSLLSAEAERDILLAEIDEARNAFLEEPYLAQESLVKELQDGGLDKADAYQVVKVLSQKEDTLFNNFRGIVLDLPSYEDENPWINATVMFFAFILGSLFPIVPFLITEGIPAFFGAIVATGVALFTVGALKGKFSKTSILQSGLKFFVVAVIAGIASELIGSLVSIVYGV